MNRFLILLLVLHTAFAQAQFSATTRLVLTPVSVKDRAGKSVDGLTAADFELYEKGAQRKFELESTFAPISLVVALQLSLSELFGTQVCTLFGIGGLRPRPSLCFFGSR